MSFSRVASFCQNRAVQFTALTILIHTWCCTALFAFSKASIIFPFSDLILIDWSIVLRWQHQQKRVVINPFFWALERAYCWEAGNNTNSDNFLPLHWVCLHGLESRSERRFKTWFGLFLIWKPDFSPCKQKAVSNQAFGTRFETRKKGRFGSWSA